MHPTVSLANMMFRKQFHFTMQSFALKQLGPFVINCSNTGSLLKATRMKGFLVRWESGVGIRF